MKKKQFFLILLGGAILAGYLTWSLARPNGTSNQEIDELAASIQNQRPGLPTVPPELAHGDAMMMSGPAKGKK
jgi:hypothetical protein